MKTRSLRFLFALLLAVSSVACSREPELVARLNVAPTPVVVRAGQCTPVTLRWTPVAELRRREGNPVVFVHLLDGPHNLVRTFDHPLAFPWSVGKTTSYTIDLCQSAIASPLAAGTYHLKVGLYDDVIGYRWPLQTNGVDAGKRGYRVGQVVVPATPGDLPRFIFDGAWGAREALDDKQVRARQQFKTGARLKIEGVNAAGVARLNVHIPEKPVGATTIATTCGATWESAVAGHHVVELPIADSSCEINFSSADPKGAFLEGVGWKL